MIREISVITKNGDGNKMVMKLERMKMVRRLKSRDAHGHVQEETQRGIVSYIHIQ